MVTKIDKADRGTKEVVEFRLAVGKFVSKATASTRLADKAIRKIGVQGKTGKLAKPYR